MDDKGNIVWLSSLFTPPAQHMWRLLHYQLTTDAWARPAEHSLNWQTSEMWAKQIIAVLSYEIEGSFFYVNVNW